MHTVEKFLSALLLLSALVSAQCSVAQSTSGLSPALKTDLTNSHGVFVVPTVMAGRVKPPRETWFVYVDGAIFIPSSSQDPRVNAIQRGAPDASIAIGTADGPSLTAIGTIVTDPKLSQAALDKLQSKYPDLWQQYGGQVHRGLTNGSSVMVKYTPKDI